MDYVSISSRESQVISEIRERDMTLFTPIDVRRFLSISNENSNRILQSMLKKGIIVRIEHGKYILKDLMDELDLYEIVSFLCIPSYISHFSALHFHHMTDQVPRTVFIITTKRKRDMEIQRNRIKFVTIDPDLFFGYERYGKAIVSDPEKTIIDSLRMPEYSGGIEHICTTIDEKLDLERLMEYTSTVNSSALSSRLGYIMEKKGIDFDKEILKASITTYTKLEPGKEMDIVDNYWKIYTSSDLKC